MIAIIGGGPAGIALAAALDKRSMPYDLFEAHQLGATWRAAPRDLRVLSPWWTNVLLAKDMLDGNPLRKPRAGEYLRHLLAIAQHLEGQVHEHCRVDALSKGTDGRWSIHTQEGERGPYSAVVLATGYFCAPKGPEPSVISDGSVPTLHAAQIQDYAQLENLRSGDMPVVVVGRRVSAGQLVLELNARAIPCALSLRSAIEFRRHGHIATLRETAYFFYEELQSVLKPRVRRASYPVMDGGRTRELVESAEVPILPSIRRIEAGKLVCVDGSRVSAAAVVYATGYRAALDLLPGPVELDEFKVPMQRNFEIQTLPGVYLLGFDNLYDHRSRYLRGIRQDAVRLAKRLASRLSPAN